MENLKFTAEEHETGIRLDQFLTEKLDGKYSRSYIQSLIEKNHSSVNNAGTKSNMKLKVGDIITLEIPDAVKPDIAPENLPIEIVYEDSSLAVINKKYGMSVHTGAGIYSGTLVNALMYHLDDLSSISGEERPGIVHRLDKDTSGLMVIAKNDAAHRNLSLQFSNRETEKEYNAIVIGTLKNASGVIQTKLSRHPVHRKKMAVSDSGREAITEYKTIKRFNTELGNFTFVSITIKTGRTHQIRVHLSHLGNPVVGDTIYSKSAKKFDSMLMLASVRLGFTHPETGEKKIFTAELPDHMKQFLSVLEKRPI